ncbi:hypothetical protein J0H33_13350 [bacterium]|nr:hypothetical protein [bacterium]
MSASRKHRTGFSAERRTGMKVALTGISLAGFAAAWVGFANGSHPGGQSSATSGSETPAAPSVAAQPVTSGSGSSIRPDDSQTTPSYSLPTHRTSRGS